MPKHMLSYWKKENSKSNNLPGMLQSPPKGRCGASEKLEKPTVCEPNSKG